MPANQAKPNQSSGTPLTLEVKPDGLGVEVPELPDLEPCVLEDGDVVSPRRVGYVDGGALAAEASHQLTHHTARSGPRQRLPPPSDIRVPQHDRGEGREGNTRDGIKGENYEKTDRPS